MSHNWRPTTGLLFIPRVIYKYGHLRWIDIYRRRPKNSKRNLSQCHFFRHNFHPDANPGLRDERPATNRLSHSTDFTYTKDVAKVIKLYFLSSNYNKKCYYSKKTIFISLWRH
jgi:hypothetical protein